VRPQEPERYYAAITALIAQSGFPSEQYKSRCVQRRIAVRMRAHGVQTYKDYLKVLRRDPSEQRRLLETLTINVSRFFRNRAVYDAIAQDVIPTLWDRSPHTIRIWSAGCAAGEEAYSIAALFHRHAEALGQSAIAGRIEVIGSDVDRESLAAGERGVYPRSALIEVPRHLRERYFETVDGRVAVGADLRGLVHFEHRDLILGREPAQPFDLVLCRNVIIYLEPRAQQALIERLHRALSPEAYLVLGRVEAIVGGLRKLFAPVSVKLRIYKRL
jgi:chemotaxis protein methyltransferase CheR